MPRPIFGLDDPMIIQPNLHKQRLAKAISRCHPDARSLVELFIESCMHPRNDYETIKLLGSYYYSTEIRDTLDFDVVSEWYCNLMPHHQTHTEESYLALIRLFQHWLSYLDSGFSNAPYDCLSDWLDHFPKPYTSHFLPKCRYDYVFLGSFDRRTKIHSPRLEADQPSADIDIEETDLEGIDGFAVANGITARIEIKQALTQEEKRHGIQQLLKQSECGQKIGVYIWCLDEVTAETDKKCSAVNEAGGGNSTTG